MDLKIHAIASVNRTRALLESNSLPKYKLNLNISVLTHLDTYPKSYLSSLMPTIRERERAKKALNYKAFSNLKLRLGCSNIQGPKPFDLRLTSSKALIYYYN